jgi:hypothetical protein
LESVGEQVTQLGLHGTGIIPQVLLGSKTEGSKQDVHVAAVSLQVLQVLLHSEQELFYVRYL